MNIIKFIKHTQPAEQMSFASAQKINLKHVKMLGERSQRTY